MFISGLNNYFDLRTSFRAEPKYRGEPCRVHDYTALIEKRQRDSIESSNVSARLLITRGGVCLWASLSEIQFQNSFLIAAKSRFSKLKNMLFL